MALIVIHSLICSTNISTNIMYQALCQVQEIKQRANPCHHEAHEADEGTSKKTNNIIKSISVVSFIDKKLGRRTPEDGRRASL